MSGHVQDLLSAYLDGELSPPERAMVEAHLAACEACATRLEDFETLDATLRALPIEAPADYFDAFPGRLRERLRGRAAPTASWRVPVWGWAAAAALILAILTPLTLRQMHLSPVPDAAVARAPAASGAAAPARSLQADDEAPAPRASDALRSAPDAAGRGGLGESARVPPAAPAAPPASAPEPEQAVVPGGEEDAFRKSGPGTEATFAAPPAEVRREAEASRAAVAQRQGEERQAGLAASSRGELGLAAAPPAPRASVTGAPRPAGVNASREDAPAEAGAAPPAAKLEAPARLADAERDSAESDRKDKSAAESEGGAGARAAGARGRAGTPGHAQDEAAADEFAALRARATSGAATPELARALRDDWRSFAARNPAGPRGDEARLQVIEAGYRAWRVGRDARDLVVLARDARTYLERADAAHAERVRAILAEIERE